MPKSLKNVQVFEELMSERKTSFVQCECKDLLISLKGMLINSLVWTTFSYYCQTKYFVTIFFATFWLMNNVFFFSIKNPFFDPSFDHFCHIDQLPLFRPLVQSIFFFRTDFNARHFAIQIYRFIVLWRIGSLKKTRNDWKPHQYKKRGIGSSARGLFYFWSNAHQNHLFLKHSNYTQQQQPTKKIPNTLHQISIINPFDKQLICLLSG